MRFLKRAALVILLLVVSQPMNAADSCTVLKASFHPNQGMSVEYGQGALERTELPHWPLDDTTWLVRAESSDKIELQRRLNAALEPDAGFFEVIEPLAEEQRRADSGEIRFQH